MATRDAAQTGAAAIMPRNGMPRTAVRGMDTVATALIAGVEDVAWSVGTHRENRTGTRDAV